jgi:hypothetical protein
MPATIDMRLFWISLVMFFVVLYFAPRISRHASDRSGGGRLLAKVFICVTALLTVFLMVPLTSWRRDDGVFGQFFSWFCAHAIPAVLFARMSLMMHSRLQEK